MTNILREVITCPVLVFRPDEPSLHAVLHVSVWPRCGVPPRATTGRSHAQGAGRVGTR